MADKNEAKFTINIDGNASVASKEIASSTRLAADSITKYESEVKTLSADLRRLRGNSEEVVAAKAALKKRIDEAKTSASSLTAELTKQGTSYAAAAAAAKKYGDGVGKLPNLRAAISKATGGLGDALAPTAKKISATLEPIKTRIGDALAPTAKKISDALGPVGAKLSSVRDSLSKVGKAAAEDAGSVLPSLSTAFAAVAGGAAIAAASIIAVGAGLVGATIAVGAFGIAAAAAASKMQRQREAILGNAQDAKALGEQISVLAGKVPQGVAELNDLGRELSKTRLSGKAIVDTMAAVAQATGAVDAGAGSKIQELLTRFQNTGRFALGRFELQGTGIDFEDVAKEYAAGAHKTVDAARKELLLGQVPLEAAAETLRRVTEKKFGEINVKNAFSLENAPKKIREQLSLLSSGVDLSPISRGLQDAFGQLQENAPLGAAIKNFMSTFGGGLVDIAAKGIPAVLEGLTWMVVGALKVATAYYNLKADIKEALKADDWIGAGKAIVNGLVQGIVLASSSVPAAIIALGKTIKSSFAGELKIHSPSKVFEGYGKNTVEGFAGGVERAQSRATNAVQGMVPPSGGSVPAGIPSALSGGGDAYHFHFHGPTDREAVQAPDFLANVTRALRNARSERGLPA